MEVARLRAIPKANRPAVLRLVYCSEQFCIRAAFERPSREKAVKNGLQFQSLCQLTSVKRLA
jgi:hypothetical protein